MEKIYTRYLKKLRKAGESQIFDVLLTGPRDPRYGSGICSIFKELTVTLYQQ
jgi:hypothetical protein